MRRPRTVKSSRQCVAEAEATQMEHFLRRLESATSLPQVRELTEAGPEECPGRTHLRTFLSYFVLAPELTRREMTAYLRIIQMQDQARRLQPGVRAEVEQNLRRALGSLS